MRGTLSVVGYLFLVVTCPAVAFSPRTFPARRFALQQQANPLEDFVAQASSALQQFANKLELPAAAPSASPKRSEYDDQIEAANKLLLRAATTKSEDGSEVIFMFPESAVTERCICIQVA